MQNSKSLEEMTCAELIAVITLQADFAEYQAIQKRWEELMAQGIFWNSEIEALFERNEAVKNRHGGNPPANPKVVFGMVSEMAHA